MAVAGTGTAGGTTVGTTIASISAGGTCLTSGLINGAEFVSTNWLDACYVIGATAISNATVTVTFANNDGGTTDGGGSVVLVVVTPPAGTLYLEPLDSTPRAVSATTFSGLALTLSCTQCLVIEAAIASTSVTAVSSPYSANAVFAGGMGVAVNANTTSAAAPTWTATATPAHETVLAISFGIGVTLPCSQLTMIDFSGGTSGNQVTNSTLQASIYGAPWISTGSGDGMSVATPNGTDNLVWDTAGHHVNPNPIRFCYGGNGNTAGATYTDDLGGTQLRYNTISTTSDQQTVEINWPQFLRQNRMASFGGWFCTDIPDSTGNTSSWYDVATLDQAGSMNFTNLSLEPAEASGVIGLNIECCGMTNHTDYFPLKSSSATGCNWANGVGNWYFLAGYNTPGGSGQDGYRLYDAALRPVLSAVNGVAEINGVAAESGTQPPALVQLGRSGGNVGTFTTNHNFYDKWFFCVGPAVCPWPLLPPQPAITGNWSPILNSGRAIDWTKAGVPGEDKTALVLPSASWSQCGATISAYGTSGSPASPNTIINALNHTGTGYTGCASSTYVMLGTGTFYLANGICVGSNTELRAASPKTTKIVFSDGSDCAGGTASVGFAGANIGDGTAIITPPCGTTQQCANWVEGFAQGSTQILIDHQSTGVALAAGQILILDQPNDTTLPSGTDPFSGDLIGTFATNGGSGNGSAGRTIGGVNSSQQQFVKVVSISGSGPYLVTVTPPLYAANWAIRGKSPGAWWTGTQITNSGIQNITLDFTAVTGYSCGNPFSGVNNYNAYGTWISNVRSIGPQVAAGASNSVRNHFWNQFSNHVTVQNSYFVNTGPDSCQYGGEDYEAADNLVINSIFQHMGTGFIRGADEGTVTAYNYNFDNYADPATILGGDNFLGHDAFTYMNLAEGNYATQFTGDDVHGVGGLLTAFRNRIKGNEDASLVQKSNNTVPINLNSYARKWSTIGNVIGTGGQNTVYWDDESASNGTPNASNLVTGWSGFLDSNSGGVASDSAVKTTLLLWGNNDAATGTRWNSSEIPSDQTVPANHTLPASFIVNSQPAWWTNPWVTIPWPAIGPDVTASDPTGHASTIPAGVCFANAADDPAYSTTYTITAGSFSAGTEELTVGTHTLLVGDQVSGIPTSGTVLVTAVTSTTFSYAAASNPGISSGTFSYPHIKGFDAAGCYNNSGGAPTVSKSVKDAA